VPQMQAAPKEGGGGASPNPDDLRTIEKGMDAYFTAQPVRGGRALFWNPAREEKERRHPPSSIVSISPRISTKSGQGVDQGTSAEEKKKRKGLLVP